MAEAPELPESSQTIEQLAKAEVITRNEYQRLKSAKPNQNISAKFIVSEVRPNSSLLAAVNRPPQTRKAAVRLSTSSIEKSEKEVPALENSQAATRPETTAKPPSRRRNAPRRATEFFVRPTGRYSNFFIDKIERSTTKPSRPIPPD